MNILIINPILYTPPLHGGRVPQADSIQNSLIVNYAKGFRRIGHSVTVIASDEYRPRLQEDYDGVEMVFLPNAAKRLWGGFPNGFPILKGFGKYLKTEGDRFDLAISSEAFTYTSFVASRIMPEKLVVWQEVGAHVKIMKGIPSAIWYNTVVRFLMRRVLFVPRSQRARSFIARYARRVSDEIVEHAVDRECFAPCKEKRHYFIVLARLVKSKNIALTISKFASFCAASDTPYELYIVGGGDLLGNLQRTAEEAGVADRVIFTGKKPREEVTRYLQHATALLTDTTGEYSTVSITEAISCGTPVITNSVPYPSDTVEEFRLGIVSDEWGADDMAEVVERLGYYSGNCIGYGRRLSVEYLANRMTEVFRRCNEDSADK